MIDIKLVSEPEATALYAIYVNDIWLRLKDVFTICDVRGGTVDLVTYEVQKLEPLKLKEVVPGSGNVCGLAFLNEAFELVIKQILGQTNIHTITTKYKVALPAARNYFEHSIKRNFGNMTSRAMTYGYGVPMNGAPDRPAHGLSLGLLKVPYAKIENTVFKPVVERILKLVE